MAIHPRSISPETSNEICCWSTSHATPITSSSLRNDPRETKLTEADGLDVALLVSEWDVVGVSEFEAVVLEVGGGDAPCDNDDVADEVGVADTDFELENVGVDVALTAAAASTRSFVKYVPPKDCNTVILRFATPLLGAAHWALALDLAVLLLCVMDAPVGQFKIVPPENDPLDVSFGCTRYPTKEGPAMVKV